MPAPSPQPSSPANGSAEWPPDDRLRRAIQYSEASMMDSQSCGVLDTRFRGYDGFLWSLMQSVAQFVALQRRKHGPGDIRGAVAAAEFHRLYALGVHPVVRAP